MKKLLFGLLIVHLLISACGGGATVTPEPTTPPEAAVTPTTVAPTAIPTPACALECDIGTESYSIGITCESGPMSRELLGDETTSSEQDSSGNTTGISLNLNRKRTYENTQNAYTIVGTIEVDLVQNTVDYEIVVTGGAFGDTPQTCTP